MILLSGTIIQFKSLFIHMVAVFVCVCVQGIYSKSLNKHPKKDLETSTCSTPLITCFYLICESKASLDGVSFFLGYRVKKYNEISINHH